MRASFTLSVLLNLLTALPTLGQDAEREKARRQQQRQPFQQVSTLPGVEFSADQQTKVEDIRKKYVSNLVELQRKLNGVYTNRATSGWTEGISGRTRCWQECSGSAKSY